jgi:hypothetical protein
VKDAEVGVDEGAYVLVNFPAQGRPVRRQASSACSIRISTDSSALASVSSSNQQLVTASTTSHSA